MKKQILFVTEKWCDANPKLALTNNFHNLFNSFSNSRPDCTYSTIHLDESMMIYGRHIDQVLEGYCKTFNVDMVIYSLLGLSSANPSIETFRKIKNLNIYQCIMWPDTGSVWGVETIKQIGDSVNLNVLWDNPVSDYHNQSLPLLENTKSMWVPQDNEMFCDNRIKDIDVSFIGSDRYPERKVYIEYIKKHCETFVFSGGQREDKLSTKEYADLIKRSKIGINFAGNPGGFWQCKGRVYEIIASNSMLLESKNPSTEKILNNNEYVDFTSPKDLLSKIQYYLVNQDERIEIANRGYDRYIKNYSSQIFWDKIMKEAFDE
jgi:hypothetical protein